MYALGSKIVTREELDKTLPKDLFDKVKVTGKVDTSKVGTYQITYSVVNSRNVTTKTTRTIIVVEKGKKPTVLIIHTHTTETGQEC